MFDWLQMMIYRWQEADSLELALKQLVCASLVREAKRKAERSCDILGILAKTQHFDLSQLLEEVAVRLRLPVVRELVLPSASLIAETGYDADFLRKIPALPQPNVASPAGWVMVVADPGLVSIEEYETQGVYVLLGLADEIEAVWRRREELLTIAEGEELSEERVFSVIEQLASDVRRFGAHEVFIGHPDPCRYEFLLAEKRYSGMLSRQVYDKLLQLFSTSRNLSCPVQAPNLSRISLSLTKNFSHPVIYVSWEESLIKENEQASDSSAAAAEEIPLLEQDKRQEGPDHVPECRVELPATIGGAEKDIVASTGSAAAQRVLLVDDDPRFRAILSHVLERNNYSVSSCESAQDALNFIRERDNSLDLVISDIHMPQTDGVSFFMELRKLGRRLPVLMVTSDDDAELEAELVSLGADAYVRKQEDVRVLLAWCRNLSRKVSEERTYGAA